MFVMISSFNVGGEIDLTSSQLSLNLHTYMYTNVRSMAGVLDVQNAALDMIIK